MRLILRTNSKTLPKAGRWIALTLALGYLCGTGGAGRSDFTAIVVSGGFWLFVTARLDLEAAIGTLPDQLRLPLELHYFIGLTTGEVAIALGVPAATVRFRLMIARRRLRPLLHDSTLSTAQETLS